MIKKILLRLMEAVPICRKEIIPFFIRKNDITNC
jgi:hypothetical protein